MKKNVLTKILLILVIAMLALALFACTTDKGGNGGGGNNNNTCTNHVDNNNDGKCDICGKDMPNDGPDPIDQLVDIIGNAGALVDTVKSIKADSTIALDLSVGGFYKNADTKNSLAITASTNLKNIKSEASIGVQVNDKSYFNLGYKDDNLYLEEGLNLVNSTDTSTNKIKMDVTALKPGIDHATTEAMKALADLVSADFIQNLNLTELASSIIQEENGQKTIMGMIDSAALSDLLTIQKTNEGSKLTISEENFKAIMNLVGGFLPALSTYTGYFDTAMNTLGVKIGANNEVLTYKLLMSDYTPSLSIDINYKDGIITGIGLAIAIKSVNFEAGLTIGLPTFSTTKTASIAFSGYNAKDLKATIGVDLGVKGLNGVLDVVANTSDAFAKEGNQMASATLKINDEAAAKAAFDGKSFYLDFTDAYAILGATKADGTISTYKAVVPENNFSVISMINNGIIDNVNYCAHVDNNSDCVCDKCGKELSHVDVKGQTDPNDKKKEIADGKCDVCGAEVKHVDFNNDGKCDLCGENMPEDVLDFVDLSDIWKTAYEGLYKLASWCTKEGWEILPDDYTKLTKDYTEASVIDLLTKCVGQYTNFLNDDTTSLSGVWANIVKIYNDEAKALLDGATYFNATEKRAGIQLFGNAGKNAVEFVLKFINIKKEGVTQDEAGLISWICEAVPEKIANNICSTIGVESLSDILTECYIGVGADKGIAGYIEIRDKAAIEGGKNFGKLSASLLFVTDSVDVEIPSDLSDITDITAYTGEVDAEEYYIFTALQELGDAVLAYTAD